MGELPKQHENGDAPIVVIDLRKTFGEQKVLNGINIRVAQGETVAVLGRSGTGKSVLLRILIGLQSADSGSVCILGQEITQAGTNQLNDIRKRIGFLFQQSALYDSMTVEENVAFPLSRHVKDSHGNRKQRVHDLLARVDMDREIDKLPSQISGGMQKRVGLARALILEPEILLLDEPTAGLDPITATEIAKLILALKQNRKMTAIVVTHDVSTAKLFSDRLLMLDQGTIRAEGTFADLQKSHDDFVSQFMGESS